MDLRTRLDRFFTPRVILLVGWILFVLYAYPGYMSADSVAQLVQARGLEPLTDWHPPMMAVLWRYLDRVFAGPFPMLVLQSVPFLLGIYFILVRVMSRRAAAITAAVFLLLPNNIIVMAVIWKDSLMAGFLLAGIAGLLAQRLRWRLVGCLCIFLATAVRYNTPAAALPLVVLLWDRDLARPWLKRHAIAFAVWLGVTAAAFLANNALADEGARVWEIGGASVEIEGILHFAPDIDIDQLVRENPDVPWAPGVDIRSVVDHQYKPTHAFNYMFEGDPAIFVMPTTSVQITAIGTLFKQLVREHPDAYMRHRLAVAGAQLRCAVSVWNAYTMDAVWAEGQTHHRGSQSRIQHYWVAGVARLVRGTMFRPRPYFILAFLLLPLARRDRLAVALLLSGLMHELALFAIAPSVAYRYSHWMVACTLLAAILLVAERVRTEASSRSPRGSGRSAPAADPRASAQ